MANRFWVGGAGTWDTTSTANWSTTTGGASGASAPGAADVAIFNANSGSGYTVTLGANIEVQTVTANAAINLTIDFVNFKITVNSNNALVFRSAAIEYLGTPVVDLTYSGAVGTRSIVPGTAAVTNPPQFNILAGTDTITFTTGASGKYSNVNFTGFSGTWTSITGSTNISLFGDLIISSGMTITAAGAGSLVFSATSGTKQITTNGKTIPSAISFNGIGGTFAFQDALTQSSTRAFTIVNGTVQLKNGVTSTVGGFATSGTNQKFLQSTAPGSQATLSQASGTVDASYLTIRDINAVGGATWNAFVNQQNIDAGNNDGWDFGISPIVGSYEYTYQLRSFTQPRRF
jgi:hypothetical protein